MTREPGFYWVRRIDKWEVAEWDGDWWFLCGHDLMAVHPFEGWGIRIDEIEERRIERE